MTGFEQLILALAIVLLFVAAFLAMSETSLSRIDRFRAQALAEEKRRGSVALLRLVESPERFSSYLNSVLLLLLSTQIVATTAVAYLVFTWWDGWVVAGAIVVEIILAYVIAEAMPKTWAVQHTERSALLCAPVIRALASIVPMRLITRPLIWSANVLLPGKGLAQGPFIYEQQILALADTAAEEKVIERDEHRLIHSVIEFNSTVARAVMVPRTDMIVLGADSTVNAAVDVAIAKGVSRIPVHGDENDEILGTLFTKDLLRAVHEGQGTSIIRSLLRPVKFIPETKRVAELMREMQLEKVHMSIVIDEYGAVVGLVTLEDLIEEVVGEIVDEYDVEQQPRVERLPSGEWRIDARMGIDEVYEAAELRLPHGDWDTVGGLLINAFGSVPKRGENVVVDDYKITVEAVSGQRILRVRIREAPVETPVDVEANR